MVVKDMKKQIAALDGSYLLKIELGFGLDIAPEFEEDREWFEDVLYDQIHRGLKGAIETYKANPLPDKYLDGQVYVAENQLPDGIYGYYNSITDEIHLDADVISGTSALSGAFLIGHEIGHKIIKYRNVDPVLLDIAHCLGISALGRGDLLAEIFADECGKIASGSLIGEQFLRVPIEANKREGIHRKILSYVSQ